MQLLISLSSPCLFLSMGFICHTDWVITKLPFICRFDRTYKEGSFSIGDTEDPTNNWYTLPVAPVGGHINLFIPEKLCNKSLIKNELFSDVKYILMSLDSFSACCKHFPVAPPHPSDENYLSSHVYKRTTNRNRTEKS